MKLILLSGLDGTAKLFEPFIKALPKAIETQVISYPTDKKLGYQALISLVENELPKTEEFVLLAESFSGYIAYAVALNKPKNLKALVFVATFLENPRPLLSKFLPFVPVEFILSLPIPSFVAKRFLLGVDSTEVGLLQETLKGVPANVLYHRLLEIVQLPMAVETLEVKAIYLQASHDKLVPKHCYDVFEKCISDIELFEVEGSHLLLQGNPNECAEIVKKFIGEK